MLEGVGSRHTMFVKAYNVRQGVQCSSRRAMFVKACNVRQGLT